MNYNKIIADIASRQAAAIWNSHGNYSKYIFLFHCDELLDAYSFLVDEKNYNSMQEMRIKYNNEKRWNDSVIGWLSLYLTVKS